MEKVEVLLKQFGTKYSHTEVNGQKELQLYAENGEPWGNIGVKDGKVYAYTGPKKPQFRQHGNHESGNGNRRFPES